VFPRPARWLLVAGAVAVAAGIVAWSATLGEGRDPYVLAHAVATAPFVAVAWACAWWARRCGPPEQRGFWTAVLAGCTTAALATAAALGAVAWDSPVLLRVDAAMVVAGGPPWVAATMRMVRLLRGKLSMSVDLVDAATALTVLGAPVVLLVADPLRRSEGLAFAVPFALSAVTAPGGVYLAVVNLTRVPRGERAALAIGVALGVSFSVSVSLQLARVVGEADLPLPVLVGAHAVTMILVMALPLWARRRLIARPAVRAGRVGREIRAGRRGRRDDPGERVETGEPVRANPMPYVSAAALPVLAAYVLATRHQRPWGVPFLVGVLLAVVALAAVRHTVSSRETARLQAGLVRMAEERRRLLADLLRALEDDRRRTAGELHAQAVRSLTTLVTTIQSAYAALPSDTALVVKEAMTQAQDDLVLRAEELRQLTLAMRPPGLETGTAGTERTGRTAGAADSALGSALSAYASELFGDGPPPTVRVHVDPTLHLDWATTTIAYRIAQEALANAAHHADAKTVTVRVGEEEGAVLVEVVDDGAGFRPGPAEAAEPGSGLAAMELFTRLGRGELTVRSRPGEGTAVRCLLGVRGESAPPGRSRHLRLVDPTGETDPD
jgi:signal transduction histidine kinase